MTIMLTSIKSSTQKQKYFGAWNLFIFKEIFQVFIQLILLLMKLYCIIAAFYVSASLQKGGHPAVDYCRNYHHLSNSLQE